MRATDDILEPLAKASGGSVHWLADGMPACRRVAPAQAAMARTGSACAATAPIASPSLEQQPLLPAWAALLLVVGRCCWLGRSKGDSRPR